MCPKIHSSTILTILNRTVSRTWKPPDCPSTEEWKSVVNIHTMEYYSSIKSNEPGSLVERWMDLESDIQNEVRKRKTNIVF